MIHYMNSDRHPIFIYVTTNLEECHHLTSALPKYKKRGSFVFFDVNKGTPEVLIDLLDRGVLIVSTPDIFKYLTEDMLEKVYRNNYTLAIAKDLQSLTTETPKEILSVFSAIVQL